MLDRGFFMSFTTRDGRRSSRSRSMSGYTAGANGRCIDLRGLELDLTGIIDLPVFFGLKEGQAGFQEIDIVVRIDSDASPDALEALHEAVLRTSPVGNTLERPGAIHTRLERTPTAVAA